MALTFKDAFPVFVRVTDCAALAVFKLWLEKVKLVGVRVATGMATADPVPVRLTVCGLPGASSLMVRVPLRVPAIVGVKVTLMEQLALAAIADGQLLA